MQITNSTNIPLESYTAVKCRKSAAVSRRADFRHPDQIQKCIAFSKLIFLHINFIFKLNHSYSANFKQRI